MTWSIRFPRGFDAVMKGSSILDHIDYVQRDILALETS
jgi:hypothetical protein